MYDALRGATGHGAFLIEAFILGFAVATPALRQALDRAADFLGIEETPQLGYIVLPQDVNKTGALMADWDAAVLASADEVALQVAENIVNGIFWPPTVPAPRHLGNFAAVCQDHAFRPRLEGDSRKEQPA